jgi:hypothetical protein
MVFCCEESHPRSRTRHEAGSGVGPNSDYAQCIIYLRTSRTRSSGAQNESGSLTDTKSIEVKTSGSAVIEDVKHTQRTHRADIDQTLRAKRDATWAQQSKERDVLDKRTAAGIDRKRGILDAVYKPKWRALYTAQKREERHVRVVLNHPLARAAYVFANRGRLGPAGVRSPCARWRNCSLMAKDS